MREKRKNDIDPRDALLNVEFDGFGFNKDRPCANGRGRW